MRLIHRTNSADKPFFICLATYDERHVPASLDFTWHPEKKVWYSTDLSVARAAALYGHITVDGNTALYLKNAGALNDAEWASVDTKPASKKEIALEIATFITPDEVAAVHQGLKLLASVCDGARQLDGAGFNGQDVEFGHTLAAAASLTKNQAAYGKLMLRKYHGQLGDELFGRIWPEDLAEAQRAAEAKAQAKVDKAEQREETKAGKAKVGKAVQNMNEQQVHEAAVQAFEANGDDFLADWSLALDALMLLGVSVARAEQFLAQAAINRAKGKSKVVAPGARGLEKPAPAPASAQETQPQGTQTQTTAMPAVHPAGTLTLDNCTPETFNALVQDCTPLQIDVLVKHGGLSPDLEAKVRAAHQKVDALKGHVHDTPAGKVVVAPAQPAGNALADSLTETVPDGRCSTCGAPIVGGKATCDHASAMHHQQRAEASKGGRLAVCNGCDKYVLSGQHKCPGKPAQIRFDAPDSTDAGDFLTDAMLAMGGK